MEFRFAASLKAPLGMKNVMRFRVQNIHCVTNGILLRGIPQSSAWYEKCYEISYSRIFTVSRMGFRFAASLKAPLGMKNVMRFRIQEYSRCHEWDSALRLPQSSAWYEKCYEISYSRIFTVSRMGFRFAASPKLRFENKKHIPKA